MHGEDEDGWCQKVKIGMSGLMEVLRMMGGVKGGELGEKWSREKEKEEGGEEEKEMSGDIIAQLNKRQHRH